MLEQVNCKKQGTMAVTEAELGLHSRLPDLPQENGLISPKRQFPHL
jgi:hypothetical protein